MTVTSRSARVIVAQRGAREHYLAAESLAREGMLAALVTDWYAPSDAASRGLLGVLGGTGQRMLAARSAALPDDVVIAFRPATLAARLRSMLVGGASSSHAAYLAADLAFGSRVAGTTLPPHDVVFAYSYGALEILESAIARGALAILDQIDPGPAEFRIVAAEADAWPQYAGSVAAFPQAYFDRLREEWQAAHAIVVNSEWSRDALIAEGVPAAKIDVLPLAYDATRVVPGTERPTSKGPVRVLWLGQVNLRKGIPYLVEAARLLQDEAVEFVVVGQPQIPAGAMAEAPANVRWVGPVPRDQVGAHYAAADVFVLPTISDGFAITQLEAMAHGVPVIATPNCGRVVQEGRNGYLVPARDAPALADALRRFVRDRDLSGSMRSACFARAAEFSPDAYRTQLVQIIRRRLASPASTVSPAR